MQIVRICKYISVAKGIFSIGFMKANLILVDRIRLNYLGDTYNYLAMIQKCMCDVFYIDCKPNTYKYSQSMIWWSWRHCCCSLLSLLIAITMTITREEKRKRKSLHHVIPVLPNFNWLMHPLLLYHSTSLSFLLHLIIPSFSPPPFLISFHSHLIYYQVHPGN